MRRLSFSAAAALITVTAAAASLHAQSFDGRTVQFGLMGGFTKPVGELSTSADLSGNAGALVTIGALGSRVRFRLDGQWQGMTGKVNAETQLLCVDCSSFSYRRNYRVFDATANAVVAGSFASNAKAYVIGGVGVYHVRGTNRIRQDALFVTQSTGATRFGFNGGVGLSVRLGHVATFVESRYHQLLGSHTYENDGFNGPLPGAFQFVPISVGIVF